MEPTSKGRGWGKGVNRKEEIEREGRGKELR